jgi:hypothetical protein
VGPALSNLFRQGGPVATIFGQLAGVMSTQVVPALTSLWDAVGPKLLGYFQAIGGFIGAVFVPVFQATWHIISDYVVPILRTTLTPIITGLGNVFHTVTAKIMEHKDTFVGLYNSIQPFLAFIRDKVAPVIGGAFRIAFEVAGKAIGFVVDVIAKIVDSIKWILDKGAAIGRFVGKLFGADSSSGTGGATRGASVRGASATGSRLFGAAGSLGGGGAGPSVAAAGLTVPVGDTYVITVQGALDPTAVADQIARLLDQRARRIGQRPAFSA